MGRVSESPARGRTFVYTAWNNGYRFIYLSINRVCLYQLLLKKFCNLFTELKKFSSGSIVRGK